MDTSKSQQLEIRDTTFDDIPKMRAMHGQSWRDTYPSPENGVTQEWIEQRTADWITPDAIEQSQQHFKAIFGNPNHLHQVALNGDEIVGIVHVSKNDHGQHLEALYIDKGYYGTGLAQRLMDRALNWCDPSWMIDLEVATYNERAKAFYKKYGFEEKPGSEQKFADVIPVVTMIRKGDAQ
jgi:ribosomal protein S18 acetylase RimI-like enzyme